MEKTPTLGSKIDLVFMVIRLGLFFSDADLIARNVEKAQWYGPFQDSRAYLLQVD
jgi:26S proteasome regulatory subunit N7